MVKGHQTLLQASSLEYQGVTEGLPISFLVFRADPQCQPPEELVPLTESSLFSPSNHFQLLCLHHTDYSATEVAQAPPLKEGYQACKLGRFNVESEKEVDLCSRGLMKH